MIQPSAISIIDEAIKLHQTHMDNPKAETAASREKEMALLMKARKALEGMQKMPMMSKPQGMGTVASEG